MRRLESNKLMVISDFAVGDGTIVIMPDGREIQVKTLEDLEVMIQDVKDTYTKLECDSLFANKKDVYTKAESDNKFDTKPLISKTANGYWRCTSTGFTIQWGNAQLVKDGTTVSFPTPFNNFVGSVTANSTAVYGTQYPLLVPKDNIQLDQCLIKGAPWIAEMKTFNWIAVGF